MVVSQLGPHNHLISNTPEWSYCFIKKAPKNNHFFLSSWVGSILQILQSDWFWEWSVFSPCGPLTVGGTWKNVLKFSWKPFKSPFNIITQIKMFWCKTSLFHLHCPCFLYHLLAHMENLVVITTLHHSGSFCNHLLGFKKK